MQRHERFELMEYRNEQLMDELNEFMVAVKVWLFDEAAKLRSRYPKPDLSEIDNLQSRINTELRKDAMPMRR